MISRATVFGERRQFNQFGAQDDFRSIVQRRLVALQYLLNDQGAVVDTSGNTIVDASDDSGTGQTPAELAAIGYTPDQIANLAGSSSSIATLPGVPAKVGPPSPTPSGSGTSSWVSGLSGLFGAIGTTFTNVTRATSATGRTINPQTGLPYGINPQTGLPYTSATSQSTIMLVAVALIVGYVVFKR